ILAGGGIVARLLVDYPQFLPNSYVGFLIYRAGPTIVLLWACAAATIAVSPLAKRLVLLSASCGSIRSEEHTSELQSLMRISYAVFCLKNNIQPLIISKN